MTPERCILIIDDSAVIRQIAELTLGSRGWRILTAETGPQGIAMAASERPDAILLDVVMPDPDGLETLSRLRDDAQTAGIPVIFLTGLADTEEERAKLSALGAAGVLAKPFDPNTLAELVAGVLRW
jgi:two-component system alkaline phosphatase synthesis response regulator PhoP